MKTKVVTTASLALLLSGMPVAMASAQEARAIDTNVNVEVRAQTNEARVTAQSEMRGNATSSAAQSSRGNATSTNARIEGRVNAEEHRSEVASFVRSLLTVANREGGIGSQVRTVAMSQQDSASTSASAIAKVEERGALRTFLFGTDYKSLGQLRSEIATTSANIKRLQNLRSQMVSGSDSTELSAQIRVLEDSQARIEAYVKAHESTFSLFGWVNKVFAK